MATIKFLQRAHQWFFGCSYSVKAPWSSFHELRLSKMGQSQITLHFTEQTLGTEEYWNKTRNTSSFVVCNKNIGCRICTNVYKNIHLDSAQHFETSTSAHIYFSFCFDLRNYPSSEEEFLWPGLSPRARLAVGVGKWCRFLDTVWHWGGNSHWQCS